MCSICKTFYVNSNSLSNCCKDCERKIEREYKDKIIDYIKNHPGARIMDIINSDVLNPPKEYDLSPMIFKKMVLNICNSNRSTSSDIDYEKNIDPGSALTRDLEELKATNIKPSGTGSSWHSTKK